MLVGSDSFLMHFTWFHCWHLLEGNKSDSYLHYDGFSKELILCDVDLWSGKMIQNLCAVGIRNSQQGFSFTLPDASKATFTASPSSCFLANRNKAAPLPSDTSVKNECLGEQTYVSLSAGQPSSAPSGLTPFTTGDGDSMQLTGVYQLFQLLLP